MHRFSCVFLSSPPARWGLQLFCNFRRSLYYNFLELLKVISSRRTLGDRHGADGIVAHPVFLKNRCCDGLNARPQFTILDRKSLYPHHLQFLFQLCCVANRIRRIGAKCGSFQIGFLFRVCHLGKQHLSLAAAIHRHPRTQGGADFKIVIIL